MADAIWLQLSASSHAMPPRSQPAPFSFDVPTPRPEHVQRFQALYRERYDVALDDAQAADKLTALLVIVRYRRQEAELQRFLQTRSGTSSSTQSPEP